MKILRFEDSIAWQKSKILSIVVYSTFRSSKDFSFRDQIQRAVVSIMNNIAEGFERNTNKELSQFLYIAKGSAGEVRSMILLAYELEYISSDEKHRLVSLCEEISKLISGFIKTL
jgi:four helix bundle protein